MTTSTELEELLDQLNEIEATGFTAADKSNASCPELAAMVAKAFANPLFYPPIQESMYAGDTVAVLLQSDLPLPGKTLDAVLAAIRTTDVEPADVMVVVSKELGQQLKLAAEETERELEDNEPVTYRLPDDDRFNSVRFEIHDSGNEHAVAYIAANEAGEPVYVNRSLFDADVIIPIGCSWGQDRSAIPNCLYPDFSTLGIQTRFRKHDGPERVLTDEIDLANESLGLFFSMELVSSPGGRIENVVCGTRNDVEKAVEQEASALWAVERNPSAELIVTTIESEPESQTWDAVTQAILSAANISDRNGPIVVWSSIEKKPPADFRKACQAQFESSIDGKLSQDLQMLAGILEERRVYLRSALSQKAIEDVGIGYIESTQQLARIYESCDSSVLVRDGYRRQIVDTAS